MGDAVRARTGHGSPPAFCARAALSRFSRRDIGQTSWTKRLSVLARLLGTSREREARNQSNCGAFAAIEAIASSFHAGVRTCSATAAPSRGRCRRRAPPAGLRRCATTAGTGLDHRHETDHLRRRVEVAERASWLPRAGPARPLRSPAHPLPAYPLAHLV